MCGRARTESIPPYTVACVVFETSVKKPTISFGLVKSLDYTSSPRLGGVLNGEFGEETAIWNFVAI